jgi:hypothetical protein
VLHGCDLRIRKHAQFYLHIALRFPSLLVPSHLHRPFLHHYYPIFLFTESTNILRNLYYFLSKLHLSDSPLGYITGLSFASSFFLVRIVFYFTSTAQFVLDLFRLRRLEGVKGGVGEREMGGWWTATPLTVYAVTTGLKVYWMVLIGGIVAGKMRRAEIKEGKRREN